MKRLEEKIKSDGRVLPGNVLKVNSFLNHQVDPKLMYEIGEEFSKKFKADGVNKILTVESSGIAPAIMTGYWLNVPVVFARKNKTATMDSPAYTAPVHSYTKNKDNQISIEKSFLSSEDNVLIIDDFLANGEATKGLIKIVNQSGAKLKGVGIVIEKSFQPGASWIKDHGIKLESLARIKSFDDNEVHFMEDENEE